MICPNCHQSFDASSSGSAHNCPLCGSSVERTISDLDAACASELELTDFSVTEGVSLLTGDSGSAATSSEGREWIGSTFGDYEILEQLGKGGMGLVFLARQRSADREVALKVIRDHRLANLESPEGQELVARFRSEARAVAHLDHENIVTLYDIGLVEQHHYFSMQLVPGKPLSQLSRERRLNDKEIAQMMVPVCRALQHAHSRGILHRDIKPVNIMVDSQNRPFITDFGLAKWFEDQDSSMTRSGQVVGTAAYMAPEQAVDAAHATIACDVYSVGATIYQLLTGRPPFSEGSLVEVLRKVIDEEPTRPSLLNRNTSADLETIALKCLEKQPEARYRSADELGDDLQRFLVGEPILARPVGKSERFWRWCKRNPAIASLAASALVLLIATVIVSLVGWINVSNAKQKTLAELRRSLLMQARAMHTSTEAGRRGRALQALRKAADIEKGSDLRDEYVRYLDQPDIEQLHEDIEINGWYGHFADYAQAVGPDRIIAVADKGVPIEIDAGNGRIIHQFDEIGELARSETSSFLASVSPNGKFLAGNSKHGKAIEIWELSRPRLLGELKNQSGEPIEVGSLVFDEDGKSIFCGGSQPGTPVKVRFFRYSVPDLTLLSSWEDMDAQTVAGLSIVEKKYLVASLAVPIEPAGATRLCTWRQENINEPPQKIADRIVDNDFPQTHLNRAFEIDPDFQRMYIGKSNGFVGVYSWPDIQPATPETLFGGHANSIQSVDVSPDGRWLVTSGTDRQLKIWDKLAGTVVAQVELDTQRINNVQWFGDATLICDTAKGLRIWKFVPPVSQQFVVTDAAGIPQVSMHPADLEFSPTEQSLFYTLTGSTGLFSRMDLNTTVKEFELIGATMNHGRNIYVSRNGDSYATFNVFSFGEKPNRVNILHEDSADVMSIIRPSDAQILNIAQLPDDRVIISELVEENLLRVRQTNPARQLFEYKAVGNLNHNVDVAAEGRRIAVITLNSGPQDSLTVFDLITGKAIVDIGVEKWSRFDLDYLGQRIAYLNGNDIVVMDVDKRRKLIQERVSATNNRFAISGDGRFLVIMDQTTGVIRIFDCDASSTNKTALTLDHRPVLPNWIAISRTGQWMATCDKNCAIRLWHLHQIFDELKQVGIID